VTELSDDADHETDPSAGEDEYDDEALLLSVENGLPMLLLLLLVVEEHSERVLNPIECAVLVSERLLVDSA